MIKKLRRRFVVIYMVILSCFLVTVLLGIYLIVYRSEVIQSQDIMQMAVQNNIKLEEGFSDTSSSPPRKIINFDEDTVNTPLARDDYYTEDSQLEATQDMYIDAFFTSQNTYYLQRSEFWDIFKGNNYDNHWYDDFYDWNDYEDDQQQRDDDIDMFNDPQQPNDYQQQPWNDQQQDFEKNRGDEQKSWDEQQKDNEKNRDVTEQTSTSTSQSTTVQVTEQNSQEEQNSVGNVVQNANEPSQGDSNEQSQNQEDSTQVTTVTDDSTTSTTSTDVTSTDETTTLDTTTSTEVTTTTIDSQSAIGSSTTMAEMVSDTTSEDKSEKKNITSYEGNLARNTIYVRTDGDGEIQRITYQYFESSNNLSLEQSVAEIIKSGSESGKVEVDNVKFRYSVFQVDDEEGYDIVFLDRAIELSTLNRLSRIFIVIGVLGVAVLFGLSWLLATWAITPIADAWDKQKQFIADASHELKTPLTIIATNTDVVLANANDTVQNQSKWLSYIKSETARMSKLVSDLLYIAKSDVNEVVMVMNEFNLSHTVQGVCLVFESVAFENGKLLDSNIVDGIYYRGDEDRIKQLITILVDNAIVHSNGNANITVSLCYDLKDKVRISVSNTNGEDIPKGYEERLFERFFRVDKARNRSNGSHGLGLNIAQSIVKNHGGTISVTSTSDHVVTFTAIL